MKKLGLVLFISMTYLTACGDDKTQAVDNAVTTDTTTKVASSEGAKASPSVEDTTADSSGKEIHQANCVRCHASVVYTREDRKVTSLDGLTKQVQMCNTQLETQLFPEDLDKVVTYLNETFYKF